MDADNGRDNRVSDFALIRKWSSHASSLVLTLDEAIPSGHAHRHASVTSLRRILRKLAALYEFPLVLENIGPYTVTVCVLM